MIWRGLQKLEYLLKKEIGRYGLLLPSPAPCPAAPINLAPRRVRPRKVILTCVIGINPLQIYIRRMGSEWSGNDSSLEPGVMFRESLALNCFLVSVLCPIFRHGGRTL